MKPLKKRRVNQAIAVTEVGLGAAQLGNLGFEMNDATARGIVDAAWNAGVRYFDTAPHYGLGLSERRLGEALRGRPRDQYTVSTKVGRLLVPSAETSGALDDQGFAVPATMRRQWDFSRDGILRSVEESLERTGLDRIDIAYLHDPDDHWREASTTGTAGLIELRDQGVVGAIGAGMNQTPMLTEFIRRCDIDVVMVAGRLSLMEQGALDELIPLALERDVAVVAAAVFNSGLLSTSDVPERATYDYAPAPRTLIHRARKLAAICELHGVSLPRAALAYPLLSPAVVSVVVGAHTPGQATRNAEASLLPVPQSLWDDLIGSGIVRDPSA